MTYALFFYRNLWHVLIDNRAYPFRTLAQAQTYLELLGNVR